MSWKTVKISDIGEIVTGKTPPTKNADNYGGSIPFITPTDMVGNRKVISPERYISEKGKATVKNCVLPQNTICVSCIGSDMGKVIITTEESVTNQQINSIKCYDNYDYRFVYYLLLTQKDKIKSLGKNATAVPILNKSKFSEIEVIVPNYELQEKIADVLSAYDDLIENNQKQIKLLEEAAQRLYKKWFIDLRFPGHEYVSIVDGVPEGWKKEKLVDIADVIMGQSPKSEFYNTDKEGLPFHQGVGSYGRRFVNDDVYSTSYTRIAEENSILFSVRAPVGRLNITKNKIVIGRGLAAINHKLGYQSYLFYMLKERFFKDNLLGNGAIFASITKDELLSQTFISSNEEVIRKFDEFAKNIDDKINALDSQTELLKQARDHLLPKLMSGELEV